MELELQYLSLLAVILSFFELLDISTEMQN